MRFLALLLCTLLHAEEALDVTKLLAQTATTYNSIQDYDIRIISSELGELLNPGAMLPSRIDVMPRSLPANHIRIARSGKYFRYEIPHGMIWVTDGTTEWRYSPAQRAYTEKPAGTELANRERTWFRKFASLPDAAGKATIVKTDNTCQAPTAVVEIQFGPADLERLWISTRTGLVCQANWQRTRQARTSIHTFIRKSNWTYVRSNGTVDESTVRFDPPKGSKRVQRLDNFERLDN